MAAFKRSFVVGDLVKIKNIDNMIISKKYRGLYGKVIELYGRITYLIEIQVKTLFGIRKKIITVDDNELLDII
jgi:ribosomal protein L21E